jgi:ribosomal-protein-alanine N-acetyltransferase
MAFVVRDFEERDLGAVLEVERSSFDRPYDEQLFRALAEEPNVFLVAEVDRRIVGYLAAVIERDTLHIVSVAVCPLWRRRGVATTLLRRAFEKGVSLGLDQAALEVDVENTDALKVYRALGFTSRATLTHYYHNGHDALLMVKDLVN